MSMLTPTGAIRARYALFMVLIAAVLVAGMNVVYTSYVQRQADRRWCALLDSLDQPNAPPTTDRGYQVQQRIRELRHDLGCGGTK